MNTTYLMGATNFLSYRRQHADLSISDACYSNLMMDESRVVPRGSHFARPYGHDGVEYNLTWRHRCTVAPVKYYYIDFGLSIWYPNGQENARATGVVGQIKDVPDFSAPAPYNPFKVDIYQLGRTFLDVIKVNKGVPNQLQITCSLIHQSRNIQTFVTSSHS
jgi:hypothetical protein